MSSGRPDIGELVQTFCETSASPSTSLSTKKRTNAVEEMTMDVRVRRDSWGVETIEGGPITVALLACKPAPLVEATHQVAMHRGHHFHRETFHF
jgi:hypothetical protein